MVLGALIATAGYMQASCRLPPSVWLPVAVLTRTHGRTRVQMEHGSAEERRQAARVWHSRTAPRSVLLWIKSSAGACVVLCVIPSPQAIEPVHSLMYYPLVGALCWTLMVRAHGGVPETLPRGTGSASGARCAAAMPTRPMYIFVVAAFSLVLLFS